MNAKIKSYILIFSGLLISIIPPIIAAISYFPIWKERGTSTIFSGFMLLLILVSIIPLFKFIKKILESPSIQFAWLAIFIIFALLRNIADEMTIISFVGFISNFIGAILFKIGKRVGDSE